jgi:predicted small secreted protein
LNRSPLLIAVAFDAALLLSACGNTASSGGTGEIADSGPEAEAGSCPASAAMCATVCVDLQNDPNNCGACGKRCCGGPCQHGACPSAGQPIVLADMQNRPSSVAVDDTNIYWANSGTNGDGAILKMPRTGGAPTPLVTAQDLPASLTIEGGQIFWINVGGPTIMAVPANGGAARVVVAGAQRASRLRSFDGSLYFDGPGTIVTVPEDGGTPVVMGSYPGGTTDLAVDSEYVFVAEYGTPGMFGTLGSISRLARVGGGGSRLAGAAFPTLIASDSSNVYWVENGTTNRDNNYIEQMPRAGGASLTLASGQSSPSALATADGYVYWLTTTALMRSRPAKGTTAPTPTALATTRTPGTGITIDSSCIYFVTDSAQATQTTHAVSGAVWSMTK